VQPQAKPGGQYVGQRIGRAHVTEDKRPCEGPPASAVRANHQRKKLSADLRCVKTHGAASVPPKHRIRVQHDGFGRRQPSGIVTSTLRARSCQRPAKIDQASATSLRGSFSRVVDNWLHPLVVEVKADASADAGVLRHWTRLVSSLNAALVEPPTNKGAILSDDQHDRPAFERDRAADRRDEAASARDRAADQRDHDAALRDDAAASRDDIAEAAEQPVGSQISKAAHEQATENRLNAASDRNDAKKDRRAGALGRTDAERDRHSSLVDRESPSA
jgi:hypothetical protein